MKTDLQCCPFTLPSVLLEQLRLSTLFKGLTGDHPGREQEIIKVHDCDRGNLQERRQ